MLRVINTKFRMPVSMLNPLVEKCFGDCSPESYASLITSLVPLYNQFKVVTDLGGVITTKTMFNDKTSDNLTSDISLRLYRKHLKLSKENNPCELELDYGSFSRTKSSLYHRYEMIEFEEKGVSEEEILKRIIEKSKAYSYWCMLRISEEKRIGVSNKGGIMDTKGNFHELNMQQFFPNYDRLKAFSIDEDDFLYNAEEKEIRERFEEYILDFRDAIKNKKSEFILKRSSDQIKKYAAALKANAEEIFSNLGWKEE